MERKARRASVRFLESTKGDGHYDKSTVFLDHLNFPNGLLPWGKGLSFSAPPDILYAEDTNATAIANVVRKLFTGFNEATSNTAPTASITAGQLALWRQRR